MADKLVVLGADRPGRDALQDVLRPLGLQLVHPDSGDAEAAVVIVDARRDPAAGLAALAQCKDHPEPPAVLLLASADEHPTPHAAWKAGADAYLTDPPDADDLRDLVGRLADASPQPT